MEIARRLYRRHLTPEVAEKPLAELLRKMAEEIAFDLRTHEEAAKEFTWHSLMQEQRKEIRMPGVLQRAHEEVRQAREHIQNFFQSGQQGPGSDEYMRTIDQEMREIQHVVEEIQERLQQSRQTVEEIREKGQQNREAKDREGQEQT
jgi:hypothetical protein